MNTSANHHTCHRRQFSRLFPAILAGLLAFAASTGFSQIINPTNAAPVIMTDNFADRPAIVLNAAPSLPYANSSAAEVYGDVSNATSEADEPYIPGISSEETVWATWTPPFTLYYPHPVPGQPTPQFVALIPTKGILTLSPSADTFSPLLTVYQGNSLTNLSLVASNNYLACYNDEGIDIYGNPYSSGLDCGCHWRERNQISFHVTNSEPFQICVDSAIITDASAEPDPTPQPYGTESYYFPPYIALQTTNTPVGGVFTLDVEFTPAPANDDFVNRLKLSGSRISLYATNAGASKEPGEPNHEGNPGGSSVWYSWTAPASGRMSISTNNIPVYAPPSGGGGNYGSVSITGGFYPTPPTCGTEIDQNPPPDFYPVFGVYTGTAVSALTPANVLPMSLAAYPNAVEFDAVKGQTYQIAFDGNLGTTGVIPLNLALTTPAANSIFKNRLQMHGVSVMATGYNAGASHQSGEPILAGSTGKNAWWSWKAPVTGTVSLDLGGSDYAFPVAVFTGSSPATLKMLAQSTGGLAFEAVKGVTYQIAVADDNGLTGAIRLDLLGPIIDLPLLTSHLGHNEAVLTYQSTPGEVVGLVYSTDDNNWELLQTKNSMGGAVQFVATPPSTPAGPYYRAIFFNQIGY